jgi:hypothetical protein
MLAKQSEEWQTLRIGDKIRFIAMPTGFDSKTCLPETLTAYRHLLKRRRPVRVWDMDEWNRPWILFQWRRKNGRLEEHSLLINHDGWVRVKSRRKKR